MCFRTYSSLLSAVWTAGMLTVVHAWVFPKSFQCSSECDVCCSVLDKKFWCLPWFLNEDGIGLSISPQFHDPSANLSNESVGCCSCLWCICCYIETPDELFSVRLYGISYSDINRHVPDEEGCITKFDMLRLRRYLWSGFRVQVERIQVLIVWNVKCGRTWWNSAHHASKRLGEHWRCIHTHSQG